MSFIGSVPQTVRQTIANFAGAIQGTVHLIGAGNFTVAAALRSGGYQGDIGSCDVSLYTSVLGGYLSDSPVSITERDDCPDHLRGLLCFDSPVELVASLALLYDLREVWQMKNPYQKRIVNEYKLEWGSLLEKTVIKLLTYKEHVGRISYEAKDGYEYLYDLPSSSTVFLFPPTYKAGYERLEKLLRATVEWEPPDYKLMTDKDLDLYRQVARFESYFVVLEKDLPEVHEIIGKPSVILPRGRSSFSHIITKTEDQKKIVLHNNAKSASVGPFWPSDRKITPGQKLSVVKISLAQSIRMNELFLSKRIDYFSGGVGVSVAFLLDGMVFGKADFSPSAHQWKLPDDNPMIYIMSDLAVPSSVENRLAKLVLLCLLSLDVKEILDLRYIESFGWACTSAFAAHPVSMKYRGIFKLHKRKETVGGFLLNYYARFDNVKISQVLEIWIKKYKK